jgi:FAD/FMN-containing dehydrogenase
VQDVSTAVRTLTRLSICKFAIRSGGHTAHAGSANIKGGVTIDLTALQEIAISADRGSVVVGPGQRWENVYAALQPYNASVAGGRAGTVGVGGSTLGGKSLIFCMI